MTLQEHSCDTSVMPCCFALILLRLCGCAKGLLLESAVMQALSSGIDAASPCSGLTIGCHDASALLCSCFTIGCHDSFALTRSCVLLCVPPSRSHSEEGTVQDAATAAERERRLALFRPHFQHIVSLVSDRAAHLHARSNHIVLHCRNISTLRFRYRTEGK